MTCGHCKWSWWIHGSGQSWLQVRLPLTEDGAAFSGMTVDLSLVIQEGGDLITTSSTGHCPPTRQASLLSPDIHKVADALSPLPQLCLRTVAIHHALC